MAIRPTALRRTCFSSAGCPGRLVCVHLSRNQRRPYHHHQRRQPTTQQNKELVRNYVGRQLAEYYAQPATDVVGRRGSIDNKGSDDNDDTKSSTTSTNPLSSLWGEWHWKRVFLKLYDTRQGQWLTPVELFKPHYSHILGNFCTEQAKLFDSDEAFEIVELGCGRGTNASLILSYLKEIKPAMYNKLRSYTLVDSSPPLHALQKDLLADGDHASKLRFELMDLVDVAEKRRSLISKSATPTIVLGLEVLDNLPHDKIRGKTRKKLEQAEVHREKNGSNCSEVFTPLTDPLLQKVIDKVPIYVSPYPRWVPSVACGVLHHIVQQRRNVALVLADFDWLPPPDLDPDISLMHKSELADGEPIVTDMSGKDHECYLTAPSHCDILFPTDFERLALFAKKCFSSDQAQHLKVNVQKQSDFLQEWGPEHVAKTESWIGLIQRHNPLLHDVSTKR